MIADEGNFIIQGEEVKAISECGMPNAELKKLNRRGRGARREKRWKIGMMECWNIGNPIVLPTIPLFHFFFLFKLCALCLLFVHPFVFIPGGSKGKEESIFIK